MISATLDLIMKKLSKDLVDLNTISYEFENSQLTTIAHLYLNELLKVVLDSIVDEEVQFEILATNLEAMYIEKIKDGKTIFFSNMLEVLNRPGSIEFLKVKIKEMF